MDLFNTIANFVSGTTIWVYVFIFFAKMIEVSLSTMRQVLINRGLRAVGSVFALFEIMIWLFVAGSILSNYRADPLKMVPYALAYALGNYLGSWLDERLALGLCSLQIFMVDMDKANAVSQSLRGGGFGVSELNIHGMHNENRYMIISAAKRRDLEKAMKLINDVDPDAMITVSDIRTVRGGYLNPSPIRGFFVGNKK